MNKLSKNKIVFDAFLIGFLVIIIGGMFGFLILTEMEAPEKNENFIQIVCLNELEESVGIKKNDHYGLLAYGCNLEVKGNYIIYIDNAEGRHFTPKEFTAEKSYYYFRIGFDDYEPEGVWTIWLYSVSDQTWSYSNWNFKGGSSLQIITILIPQIFPIFVFAMTIAIICLIFYYMLEKRKMRRLFDFPSTRPKEEMDKKDV